MEKRVYFPASPACPLIQPLANSASSGSPGNKSSWEYISRFEEEIRGISLAWFICEEKTAAR
jgi:hypothetical protein